MTTLELCEKCNKQSAVLLDLHRQLVCELCYYGPYRIRRCYFYEDTCSKCGADNICWESNNVYNSWCITSTPDLLICKICVAQKK